MNFLIALLFLSSIPAKAAELFEMHRNARALGMGNAYTGIVRGAESLFYNPAGLAKDGGYYWTIADPGIGAGNIETLAQLQNLQSAGSFQDTINDLTGKRIWAGGGGKSAITLGYFALAIYNDFDLSLSIDNNVNPDLTLNFINDYGYALGFGIPILPTLHFGMNIKRIQRTGGRKTYGADVIGEVVSGGDPSTITNDISAKGIGYSMDMGVNFAIESPVSPTFSFVWKNIGGTSFAAETTGGIAPPSDADEMIFGAALEIDTPLISISPSFDYKHSNNSTEQLAKKIHLGLEIDIPLIDIRLGLHQGYYAAGVGMSLGPLQIDVATWGVEVGAYPGQLEDRRYLVQMTIELGFDPDLGAFGGGSGSGSGKSGGRRLKQRR